MTAEEIQNSGINNSSSFQVTCKDGIVITFRADLPVSIFYTFHFPSNTLSAYKYYDTKGLQNKHIALKGENIVNIKLLATAEELRIQTDKTNSTMTIVVIIIFLIGLFVFIRKHWH